MTIPHRHIKYLYPVKGTKEDTWEKMKFPLHCSKTGETVEIESPTKIYKTTRIHIFCFRQRRPVSKFLTTGIMAKAMLNDERVMLPVTYMLCNKMGYNDGTSYIHKDRGAITTWVIRSLLLHGQLHVSGVGYTSIPARKYSLQSTVNVKICATEQSANCSWRHCMRWVSTSREGIVN